MSRNSFVHGLRVSCLVEILSIIEAIAAHSPDAFQIEHVVLDDGDTFGGALAPVKGLTSNQAADRPLLCTRGGAKIVPLTTARCPRSRESGGRVRGATASRRSRLARWCGQ
jgi:hypothetical protein